MRLGPAAYWLPSYLETSLLRAIWYPTTVATNSWANVELIGAALEKTDGSREGLPFKLHDFGARGATSREQAGIGGAAHLIASLGTDTVSGLLFARNYYGADMAGFSIPAAEHSTMTSWGGEPGEVEAMENMLTQFPTGLVAVVSDSYDLMHAINHHWGETLREQVLARDGILVVRPDSGEPTEIVPAVIEALMDKFGEQTTSTGYRLLNDKVRVIQGDGIPRKSESHFGENGRKEIGGRERSLWYGRRPASKNGPRHLLLRHESFSRPNQWGMGRCLQGPCHGKGQQNQQTWPPGANLEPSQRISNARTSER